MKRRKRKTRTITMKRVRSRGEYTFAPMGRSTRRKSKASGGSRFGIHSATSAATATLIFWLLEGGAQYLFKAMNIQTPKSRAVIPGLIALLAYKGKINVPGLFPIAVSQLMNTIKQTSPSVQSMFTFEGMNEQRPRTYAETVAAIRETMPQPRAEYSGIHAGQLPTYSGIHAGQLPTYSGKYSQPFEQKY
jgi:hypothetical protein